MTADYRPSIPTPTRGVTSYGFTAGLVSPVQASREAFPDEHFYCSTRPGSLRDHPGRRRAPGQQGVMIAVILRVTALSLASTAVIVVADLFLRAHGGWRGTIRAIRGYVDFGCRVFSRAAHLGVWLGHRLGRRVYAAAEDLVLVLPPRNGRSSYLVYRVLSQSGPTPVGDTRPDPPEPGEAGGES